MLSISHAVTGAFIATKIGNPYVAIPIIIFSHYLEDAVPHWDAGTGLGSGKKTRKDAFIHGLIDLVVAGVVVLIYFPLSSFNVSTLFTHVGDVQIWGAFIGLLPDFLEAPRNFWKYEPSWLAPINRFHHAFHHSIPRILDGLFPQILLLTLIWIFR